MQLVAIGNGSKRSELTTWPVVEGPLVASMELSNSSWCGNGNDFTAATNSLMSI